MAVNVSKEVKFVKAKEPMVTTTRTEEVKEEKNKNVADRLVLNKPSNQPVVKPKVQGKSPPKS